MAHSAVLGAGSAAFVEGALVCAHAFVEALRWREPPPVQSMECTAPTPGGFLGIPRQTIVVEEIAVDDLPSFLRQ